jgi:hypothetical protein
MKEEKFEEVIKYKKFKADFMTVLVFCVFSSANIWMSIGLLLIFLSIKKEIEAERYYKKIKEQTR